jgi:hypothetical protein
LTNLELRKELKKLEESGGGDKLNSKNIAADKQPDQTLPDSMKTHSRDGEANGKKTEGRTAGHDTRRLLKIVCNAYLNQGGPKISTLSFNIDLISSSHPLGC